MRAASPSAREHCSTARNGRSTPCAIDMSPSQRRTWLFGPGADARAHQAMVASGASVLIMDREDFTPPQRRGEARSLAPALLARWRAAGALTCVRINALGADGRADLEAVMAARPDVIAYPKACTAAQMHELDAAIAMHESRLGIPPGATEIL